MLMKSSNQFTAIYSLLVVLNCLTAVFAEDLVIADFESGTYDGWTVTSEAFGAAPAAGDLPGQMEVSGYSGAHLVNTFFNGDATIGNATSREFRIERSHIAFLIGCGPHKDSVGM